MEDPQMEQIDFSGWLHSVSAGGDKFLEQKENAFNKWLNKHNYSGKVIVGYGLTEMNSSVATRLHCCNMPTSAGIPLPRQDAKNSFANPFNSTNLAIRNRIYHKFTISNKTQTRTFILRQTILLGD